MKVIEMIAKIRETENVMKAKQDQKADYAQQVE